MTSCAECGMLCGHHEYHPYAACLMFKACSDGEKVRANLQAVRLDAIKGRMAFGTDAQYEEYLKVQRQISRPSRPSL